MSTEKRLDRHDARYVQCVFTSRTTFGSLKDCGHGNFIVNGGIVQPGCLALMCSHSRAHELFNASLFENHQFYGEQCSNSLMYFMRNMVLGEPCSLNTDRLGIHSHRKKGRFFVGTAAESPFALATLA